MAEKIQDIMTTEIHTVDAKTPLTTVAKLMRDKRIGTVLVTDPNGKLRGIVTDRDIVVRADALAKPLDKTQVGEICSGELVHVAPDASLDEAVTIMRRHSIRRIPVVRDGVPIGIVSIGDLARHKDPKSALAEISSAPPNI